MTSALRTSVALWRSMHRRSAGDRAYLGYAILLAALVTVVPLARGIWLAATSPTGVATLAPAAGALPVLVLGAALWTGALLLGRAQGPVAMAPFLAFAVGRSPVPRSAAHARPFVRAVAVCASLGLLAAAVPVLAWTGAGAVGVAAAVVSLAVGAALGVSVAMMWLVGQLVSQRTAALLAVLLATTTVACVTIPALGAFTPMGWLALIYFNAGWSPAAAVFVIVVALGSLAVPAALRALPAEVVLAHSARWDAATSHIGMLDVSSAANAYLPTPHAGRGWRAVHRVRSLPLRLTLSDAVGAARTPGRLAIGVAGLLIAGILMGVASVHLAPWLAAAGGALAYVAVGTVTDGIRHAVEAMSSTAMYGVSDLAMIGGHSLFPAISAVAVVGVAALVVVAATGGAVWGPAAGAAVVALSAVAARILDALKPPMPVELLFPIPTPMGDLSAANRVVWVLDALLLTGLAGAGVAIVGDAPWLMVLAVMVIAAVGIRRWVRR
ncbi:hypothetical protein HF576_20050 [Microbacterium sp. CFH 90308]|uniref:ABC-2 type transport system permease protein n=1 Tax=Microbacterium salsuginis TaxID=2722803 RepID=A0ABX1KGD2_9MICO|nr:hypothetical protein [Microbacterium sp. CFH 90308]NLP86131.1 hypothetical protein [Microbacterium sp. CFH 90308]